MIGLRGNEVIGFNEGIAPLAEFFNHLLRLADLKEFCKVEVWEVCESVRALLELLCDFLGFELAAHVGWYVEHLLAILIAELDKASVEFQFPALDLLADIVLLLVAALKECTRLNLILIELLFEIVLFLLLPISNFIDGIIYFLEEVLRAVVILLRGAHSPECPETVGLKHFIMSV